METGGVPDRQRRLRGHGGAGLRHVSWVRVTVSAGGTRCAAIGIGHRTPVVRRIALSMASRLIAPDVPSGIVRGNEFAGTEPRPAPAASRIEG